MSYTTPRPMRSTHALSTIHDVMTNSFNPTSTGSAYPTADLAIYVPVRVFKRVVVRKLFVCNGTAVSGNIDVGVYDAAGTRLVSAGTTAQSGTSAEQVFDVTDTTIGPGLYYVAVTLDNTTGTVFRDSDAAPLCATSGVLTEQLGAGAALPSTATWVVNQTLAYYPAIGMFVVTEVS